MLMDKFLAYIPDDGHPVFDVGIASADGVEWHLSADANECNNSHSATKAIIAAGIGILRDRNRLSLNDCVLSFFKKEDLPEQIDERWNAVTVEYALQHKMGLGENSGLLGIDADDSRDKIGDDFLKHIFSVRLEHIPGTYRKYSDAAYYILSRIMHAVSGQTADKFLLENLLNPVGFHECAFGCCPKGHPIGGGAFYARSDDMARFAYLYANEGIYNGKQIISKEWIELSAANDYAWTPFRETDIFVKTGARGQMVAYSKSKRVGISWHGCCSTGGNDRNDRFLEAFEKVLAEL